MIDALLIKHYLVISNIIKGDLETYRFKVFTMKNIFVLILFLNIFISLNAQNRFSIFEENFDDNQNNWRLGSNARTEAYIDNGLFYFESKRSGYNYSRRIEQGYIRDHQDFEIEIRFKQVSGDNTRGYALEWGGTTLTKTFYEFWLRNDGYYYIDKFDGTNEKPDTYIGWTKSDLVKIDDFNVLTVRKMGEKLQYFINNQMVHEMMFQKLEGNEIGFITPPMAQITVDYLRISLLEKAPESVFEKRIPNIWVVMVGIADYLYDDYVEDLTFTVNDVRALESFYKSPNGGAVPDENIKIVIDSQALKENILNALETTFAKAQKNDLVVFYFAGHGFAPKDLKHELYLLPHDCIPNKPATAIHYKEIEKIFDACKANKKLWIMDACHSGAIGVDCGKGSSITECLSQLNTADIAILTSADAGETSLEVGGDLKRGLFSHYLTKGLIIDAGSVDKNDDKLVNILELYEYVQKQTSMDAPRRRTGHKQNPQITGKVPIHLPLSEVKKD